MLLGLHLLNSISVHRQTYCDLLCHSNTVCPGWDISEHPPNARVSIPAPNSATHQWVHSGAKHTGHSQVCGAWDLCKGVSYSDFAGVSSVLAYASGTRWTWKVLAGACWHDSIDMPSSTQAFQAFLTTTTNSQPTQGTAGWPAVNQSIIL